MMRLSVIIAGATFAGACVYNDGASPPVGGSLRVSGEVVDFRTRTAVEGTASLSTSGLLPPPQITTHGAAFLIDGVKESSVFHVLAAVTPTHHATFSPAIEVTTSDIDDVQAFVVPESYLGQLATAFGVTPSATRGILIAQLVDGAGQPRAGVTASSLAIEAGADVKGPFFLDADGNPEPARVSTSASGWVVYFEVATGVVGLKASAGAALTVDVPISPVAAGSITIVRARATDGDFVPPTNVSFKNQVFPIFRARGCVGCHEEGNDPGRDLGNLTLNTDPNLVYMELVAERPNRVVVANPDASLLLARPLREDPPDVHPNITFASTLDRDYQLIRAWIAEGAKQN